jgi:hypothetical protein
MLPYFLVRVWNLPLAGDKLQTKEKDGGTQSAEGCVTQPFPAFAKNDLPESQTLPERHTDCT